MNEIEIIQLYNEGMSTYKIAELYDTYPNKINRILKKNDIGLKSKSEAQSLAIKNGRHQHPTKGKIRSERVKNKISESAYNYWQTISKKERKLRSEKSKQRWQEMSEQEKDNLRMAAAVALRKTSQEGSKIENFLLDKLLNEGYNVVFHHKHVIENETLEVDLFLPDLGVAVEIDGPTHFFPIWGEESLQKHIIADSKKSGLLLNQNLVVLRIKYIAKHLSQKKARDVLTELLIILEKIKNKFPPKHKRFIELEVS